jgi:hypothetical protein
VVVLVNALDCICQRNAEENRRKKERGNDGVVFYFLNHL